MSKQELRWGILGTANIARKNWQAIRNSGNGVITAVASRDAKRSQQFIGECQAHAPFLCLPKALGSYDEMLDSSEVDAVYIPLPTGLRKEWVIRAAQAGKHIVCEKPCAPNTQDLREMLQACRHHQVQFMDGVMFMHGNRLARMRETLDDGQSVGKIKRITTQFSFRGPEEFFQNNIRMNSALEPLGCLGDLGWYNVRLILWALHWAMPREITARLLASAGRADSPQRVPTDFSAELLFDEGVSASFYCSFVAENQQWTHISGDRGYLWAPDFVLPFFGCQTAFEVYSPFFNVQGCDFNMEPRGRRILVPEYSNSSVDSQETCLFRNFANQVFSKKLNEEWPEIALKTQSVVESCLCAAQDPGEHPPRLGTPNR